MQLLTFFIIDFVATIRCDQNEIYTCLDWNEKMSDTNIEETQKEAYYFHFK